MTLAKQRNYELVLPTHYVDVDQDEMEYVDGGGFEGSFFRWTLSISASECSDIAAILAGTAAIMGGITGYLAYLGLPGILAGLVGTTLCGVGSAAFWFASNHGGFKIEGMQLSILSMGGC